MTLSAVLPTALAALLLGAGLLGLILLSLRWLAARQPETYVPSPVRLPVEREAVDTGLVIAQPGGRVLFANPLARQFFGLNGQQPELWQLARQAQPSDTFLELFIAEGRASLSIGERQVEAVSVRVPAEAPGAARMMVMLRETGRLPELATGDERTAQAVQIVSSLSQTISASLDLEATLDAVINAVGRAFQYNIAEITLWDPAMEVLHPVRVTGDREYERVLARSGPGYYSRDEGLSGWLITHRRPLRVENLETFSAARPKLERAGFPFRAFLGAPLIAGQTLVGTLELVSYRPEIYTQGDLFLFNALAEQAAVALHNALQFQEQETRVAELAGLAEITRAIESTADPRELYGRLVDNIARLMRVEMAGVLLYQPAENALVGQPPFHGVPDVVVELYRIPLSPGGAAERIWREAAYWLSNQVAADSQVDELGLRELASMAGVRNTLFVPIALGGRRLGVIQVSNKISAPTFGDADVRLFSLFAGQAAAVLDNARLVGEARQRAAQEEALRQIAATIAAGTDLDSVLHQTMAQAAGLLGFDFGIVSLLDEARGELTPHPASVYGGTPDEAAPALMRTDDPLFAFSVTRLRRPFITGRALRDRRISGLYRAMLEHYQAGSVMDVPLVVGDRSLGELMVGARRERAFTRSHLQMLGTIANQLAASVERARLLTATDQDLQRRVDQLTALTRIGRELNQTLDLEHLLRLVYAEAVRVTRADCGTIVLLDLAAEAPGVQQRLGEEALGESLTPLEAEAVQSERPQRVHALAADAPQASHPGVRAALVIPILVQDAVAGLIHLHRHDPLGFDETALEAASALAAQAAIAIGNAQRYEEQKRRSELLRRRADQLGQLFQISRTVRSDQPLEVNLEAIAYGLQEAVGFNVVLISVVDPRTRHLQRVAAAGVPLARFEELRQIEQPWAKVSEVLQPRFQISQSYFLPAEESAELVASLDTFVVAQAPPQGVPAGAWHPDDMLLVPLWSTGQEPVGLLSVDSPRDGQRPDRNMIEIIEIFANQASLAIQNTRLYQATQRRAARLLGLHHVIERASHLGDRAGVWQTVADALHQELGFELCLVALRAGDGRFAIHGRAGQLRLEVDFGPLFTPAGPFGQATPHLVTKTHESSWAQEPLVIAAEVDSFLSVPILTQGELAGVLFTGARRTPSPFVDEDLELFGILANQLGGLLESARLESDIRQRAGQLAALADASQTITATLRIEDVVQAVLGNLRRIVPHDSVTLWLRTGEQLRIVAAQGFENDQERLGLTVEIADSALFTEMAATRNAIRVEDVRNDARFPAGSLSPTRSWLGAPLISKGQILGVFALDKVEPNAYTPQAAQLLMAFASQAAVALDNARLFEESEQRSGELRRRTQRLDLLNRFSAQLGRTLDVTRVLRLTLEEVQSALGVAHGLAALFDPQGAPQLAVELPEAGPSLFDPANPALELVRERLAPLAVEDVAQDKALAGARTAFADRGVRSLLVLPLAVADVPLAVVQLTQTDTTRRFTRGEIELAQTLANQAAVAVQNAQLYAETQRRLAEVETINRVSQAIASTLNAQQLYALVSSQLTEAMGVDTLTLALYSQSINLLSYPVCLERGQLVPQEPRTPEGVAGHIVLSRQPVLLRGEDIVPQLEAIGLPAGAASGMRSFVGAPLLSGERVIGVLSLQDRERPNVFDNSHLRILTTLAAQLAVAVENARFAQELEARVQARTQEVQRERERVETLLQITTELSSSLDLDRVLTRALQLVTEAVGATQGSIFLIDLESDQLIYRAALGRPRPLPPGGEISPLKRTEGLVGWVLRQRQAVVTGNLDTDERWKQLPEHQGRHKSAVAVPLMANEDALGAMILLSPEYDAFDEGQLRLAAAAANQVGAAINNAELYRLIRDQAERLGSMLRTQQVEATKSRAILEAIADGVLVTDSQGEVILFNLACERILDLPRDRILGQPVSGFAGIYGAAGRTWVDTVDRWSSSPASCRPGDYFSERLELEDQRVISVHLAPVTTGDEFLGTVSVIRDITRDVEVDRLKSEFVTNVSHELRTPMTSIKGYADILMLGAAGPINAEQARFLDVIKGNADRLSLLLNDLLDISRIESGRVDLAPQALDMGTLIGEVVDTLRGRIDEEHKPMSLEADVPAGLPAVWGDRQRVTQVLMNLADNAFNYTPAGGRITLRARLDSARQEVAAEVSDSGVGISPEDQPRLFDRFYRGEHALVMATAGTGLGLSIARQLLEMQGGRIWLVSSAAGQGSTFAIALPLAETARAAGSAQT